MACLQKIAGTLALLAARLKIKTMAILTKFYINIHHKIKKYIKLYMIFSKF